MDNISHSVIGLGVGELLHRSLAPEAEPVLQRTRHRLLLFACGFASNMPDLDLFLTGLLPQPLGYLLHHRGHTHTVLFALPQALLLLMLIWLLWPGARALLRVSRSARLGLGAALALGFGLHLAMDFLNSYGLHPFYPLDTRWFYGDMVFIVEPLFWTAFGVPLALMMPRPALRALALALWGVALCFFTWQGFLGAASAAALLLTGLLVGALEWRTGARGRAALLLAGALCVGFVGVQGAASALGKRQVRAGLARIDPGARVLDVALTAYPSQPRCWAFVSVESDEGADRYRLRRGILSLAPDWLAPSSCAAGLAPGAVMRPLAPGMALDAEFSGGLAALRRLQRDNCHVAAWLRFARAPAVGPADALDLRFSNKTDFSTLHLAQTAGRACPLHVPGWEAPRRDLLTPPL